MDFSKIFASIFSDNRNIDLEKIKDIFKKERIEKEKKEKLNIILMGATGTGKSALVNAIFGEDIVESSAGEPVTQHLEKIDIPKKNLTLWDTKGIESKDYEKTIKQLETDIQRSFETALESENLDEAPHIIWLCIKEGSSRVEGREFQLLDLAEKTKVPTVIVFTDTQFEKGDAAVEKMQEAFSDKHKKFIKGFVRVNSVKYSLTIAGQRIPIETTGLDELLEITGECLSEARKKALERIQEIDMEKKKEANRKKLNEMKGEADAVIHAASAGAATVGASPIPFSDAPLIATAQTAMIYKLNSIFKVDMEDNIAASLVTSVLATTAVGQLGRTIVSGVLKFIPGVGTVAGAAISGVTAFAITEAIGFGYKELLVNYYDEKEGKVILPAQTDKILTIFNESFTYFYKK